MTKLTFKGCGSYSWAMGNKAYEEGAFFLIEGYHSVEDIIIVENYGCSFTRGTMIFGSNYSANQYLFVPENVYPIMETMFEEMRNEKKRKEDYWKNYRESTERIKKEKMDKLSRFVDPSVPIEV